MASPTPRFLFIGPLPPPIGGTRVSFEHLVKFLSTRPELALRVVELRPMRRNPLQSFFSVIALLTRLISEVPRTDLVSLHCNPRALPVLGVAVTIIAKASRKPLIVRTFGGVPFLHEYKGIRGALTRWVLARVDLYLAQTKAQLAMAREHGIEHSRWFPTSRPTAGWTSPASSSTTCKRFVFCSHVKPSKGIHELIEAAEQLGGEILVDVYGPFRDGMTEEVFRDCRVIKYRGTLRPDEVVLTLRNYDALVLPTYFEGEGYPGSIIEAYHAGIPVIATRWQGIPEIVPGNSGVLIEPRSARALRNAMHSMMNDLKLFHSLKTGAAEVAERYSTEFWAKRLLECSSALLSGRALPDDPVWDEASNDLGPGHRAKPSGALESSNRSLG